jgi:addiction module RelE/StbE family toxin
MVRLNWTHQARDDLKSIADYISQDSKRYARLHVVRLKEKTAHLKFQPKAGKVVPEINNTCIREIVFGNYRIIYKIVSKQQVDILTIHHAARDLTKRKIP